jgi:hypothetical protein
MVLAHG